jgi:osmoprotectant transport system permease protein
VTWADLVEWFSDTPDILDQVLTHLKLAYVPVFFAVLVALPIGFYIGHKRRFEFASVTIANLGRALPSFAILALALPLSIKLGLGLGFWPTFVALFFLAVPPILTNTYVGVRSVDPDTVESARGVGLSEAQVLRQVELPLAVPLIMTGIRTAAVQSVATATLGSLVAAGGLGDYIRFGFRAGDRASLVGGAILVALLAIGSELLFSVIERLLRPKMSEDLDLPRISAELTPVEG